MAARLVRMGLPTGYVGVVDLIACHSGERRLFGLASFAAQLQQALERRERKVLVKGLKGAGIVDRWGHVRVKTNEDTFNQLMAIEVEALQRKRIRVERSSKSEEAKAQAIDEAGRAFDRRYQLLVDTYAPRHARKIVVGGRVVNET